MSSKRRKSNRQTMIIAAPDVDARSSTSNTKQRKPRSQKNFAFKQPQEESSSAAETAAEPSVRLGAAVWIAAAIAGLVLVWSYLPTLSQLIQTWTREPDYTHGWLVIPLTLFLLWDRRRSMPSLAPGFHTGGLILLGTIVAARIFARWAYFDFLDGWTLPLTVMGIAWVIGGKHWLWWAFPALFFLFFMIPLPYRIENELSRPLQWIATNLSAATLQTMGFAAIPEGTTILLGEQNLEVERACSGLRIFMGVIALAYVYSMLVKQAWWEKAILMVASIPIALLANSSRIVLTGLSYQWIGSSAGKHIAHDFAGVVMIGVAALLFFGLLQYIRWVLPQVTEAGDDALRSRMVEPAG